MVRKIVVAAVAVLVLTGAALADECKVPLRCAPAHDADKVLITFEHGFYFDLYGQQISFEQWKQMMQKQSLDTAQF